MTPRLVRRLLLLQSLLREQLRSCGRAGWPARQLLCTFRPGPADMEQQDCRWGGRQAVAAADAAARCSQHQELLGMTATGRLQLPREGLGG